MAAVKLVVGAGRRLGISCFDRLGKNMHLLIQHADCQIYRFSPLSLSLNYQLDSAYFHSGPRQIKKIFNCPDLSHSYP